MNLREINIGGGRAARMFKPNLVNILAEKRIRIRDDGTSPINAGGVYLVTKDALDMTSLTLYPRRVFEIVNEKKGLDNLKKAGLKLRDNVDVNTTNEQKAMEAIFGRLILPLPGFFKSRYKFPEEHDTAVSAVNNVMNGDVEAASADMGKKMNGWVSDHVDLSGTILSLRSLNGINLSHADLSKAYLSGASLEGANCEYVNFYGASMAGSSFKGAFLRSCFFYEADLTGADLSGSDLKGAVFGNTKLRNTDLSSCDLTGADMTRLDLREADLTGAKIVGVDFCGADLREADLTGQDLFGICLDSADLYETKISLFNKPFLTASVLNRNKFIRWVT